MTRNALAFAFACTLAFAGGAVGEARAAAQPQAPEALRNLAWLTGGTWRSVDPGVPLTVRTTYSWSANGAIIQFTTAFVTNGVPKNKYDGNFYFDPVEKSAEVWYAHDDFTITHAPVEVRQQSGFSMQFADADESNTLQTYRVLVTRTSANAYRWELSQMNGASWEKVLTLHFERS